LRVLDLRGCASLEGIERFLELRNLNVSSGKLHDLSPLSTLNKLTHLHIGHNEVESLAPLRRLFALRDLWAGYNRIHSIEPLVNLPVLHEVCLKENPVPLEDVDALERTLTSWDEEFSDPHPQTQPCLEVQIVSQETWDYYDSHPFNLGDFDGDAGLLESEKLWLLSQIENALEVDWTKEQDFVIPSQSPQARSHTVCLMSSAAAASLRSIATAIQRVLCEARNEFIIYLQTDHCEKDAPEYVVWVYRDRILATDETSSTITALLRH
jgi:hypothetical protein